MGGLAAAHELAERGFKVTVYEREALGGKARSIAVPGTAEGGRRALPGEHGFRFFPGFYHHVPDTIAEGQLFGAIPEPGEAFTVDGLRRILVEEIVQHRGIPPHEAEYFAERLLVFFTSCEERRYGEWEYESWWDFISAERMSAEYRKCLGRGVTTELVASKPTVASTRTIGHMGEAILMNLMGRGNDGEFDRVLNAPTNEAWIRPWVRLLRDLGVRFEVGEKVEELVVRDGRIAAARVRDRKGRMRRIEADWFVCAMPVEQARRLWSRDVLDLDPSLRAMDKLSVDWMTGIQFYLRREVDIVRGHIQFVDSQWALTGLTQGQFWERRDFSRDYGDGSVADCLSVDISDWDTPGILYGKPAKRCTREEVAAEVWAQIKAHLEDTGDSVLPDDILHSWFLDPAIKWKRSKHRNRNATPLLVNTVGSWKRRPRARTAVRNLFLAADYVQTDIDLATMEGGNEAGRAAVNALLEAAESNAEPVPMFKLYQPPEFEPLKRIDAELHGAGRPNALDRPYVS